MESQWLKKLSLLHLPVSWVIGRLKLRSGLEKGFTLLLSVKVPERMLSLALTALYIPRVLYRYIYVLILGISTDNCFSWTLLKWSTIHTFIGADYFIWDISYAFIKVQPKRIMWFTHMWWGSQIEEWSDIDKSGITCGLLFFYSNSFLFGIISIFPLQALAALSCRRRILLSGTPMQVFFFSFS